MPAPLKIAVAQEVIGAADRYGLEDLTTLKPDITLSPDGGYKQIRYEDASYDGAKEPQRAEGVKGGCSPFKGAAGYQTYEDGGKGIVITPGTLTMDVEVQGPGGAGDWTTTALWWLLNSRLADGGEAVAGGVGATDDVTGVSGIQITPTTLERFRVGDLFVVPDINGRPEASRVVAKGLADLDISPGLPATLAVDTAVRLCRQLYYKPGAEGPSLVFRVDGGTEDDKVRWYGVGSRLSGINARRDGGGRLIFGLTFDIGHWIADHDNADVSCTECECLSGAVAKLTNVRPAFSDDYCGTGGGFETAPHSAARMADLELEDFSAEMTVTTGRRPTFGRPLGTCEIAGGDAECSISTKLCGRSANFDDDPGAGPAKRQLIQVTSPGTSGAGVVLWYGGVQVDGLPNDPVRGDTYWEQTIPWKLDAYCGDDDGTPLNNAPNVNTTFAIGFVR